MARRLLFEPYKKTNKKRGSQKTTARARRLPLAPSVARCRSATRFADAPIGRFSSSSSAQSSVRRLKLQVSASLPKLMEFRPSRPLRIKMKMAAPRKKKTRARLLRSGGASLRRPTSLTAGRSSTTAFSSLEVGVRSLRALRRSK